MEFKNKETGGYVTDDISYGSIELAGDGVNGYKPVELFVGTVAACSGGMLRKIFDKMRVEITNIDISTESERNMEEAGRFEKIHIHFRITGKDLSAEKIEKAIELSRKNCSMTQTIIGCVEVTETYEYINE